MAVTVGRLKSLHGRSSKILQLLAHRIGGEPDHQLVEESSRERQILALLERIRHDVSCSQLGLLGILYVEDARVGSHFAKELAMGSLGGPCEDDGASIDITRVDTYRQTHDLSPPIGL